LAARPELLIEKPTPEGYGEPEAIDVLSSVLRTIRLSGSLQFCFMPSGAWQTGGEPALKRLARGASHVVPFHIVAEGQCWMRLEGREIRLSAGDVVAFPFGTGHQLGAGADGRLVRPTDDLPPKPWREIPVLRYGDGGGGVRILCGYLECDAMNFGPFRGALPSLLHVRTRSDPGTAWLAATVEQLVREVDRPRAGALSMIERLSEIAFIELLRHEILAARPGALGWLAALADGALGRCLAVIHDDPGRGWSVNALGATAGLSRTRLAERFDAVLGVSPMRYVRDWRLYLASVALSTTRRPIAAVAHEAGYGTEAAFSRAFARTYGVPPAAWRQTAGSERAAA
jgi:AraC-like DNA-binding protein